MIGRRSFTIQRCSLQPAFCPVFSRAIFFYGCVCSFSCFLLLSVCWQVVRHILTSPSSAWDGRAGATGTRPPVSDKMSVTHITPRHIAYAAVQVCHTCISTTSYFINYFEARYLLTTQETWRSHDPCDGAFNYKKFYRNILKMFSEGGQWAEDTLAWWDR